MGSVLLIVGLKLSTQEQLFPDHNTSHSDIAMPRPRKQVHKKSKGLKSVREQHSKVWKHVKVFAPNILEGVWKPR